MNDSDLEGAKTRVWCDATSSNVDRSGNDRICSTEEQCKARHTTMKNAFYASSIFSAKGCTVKGENMYFGTGGTDDEMNESVAGEQVRVWCDADKSSVVFEESTSEERSSGEDEEEEGQLSLNDYIEDGGCQGRKRRLFPGLLVSVYNDRGRRWCSSFRKA